MKQNGIVIATTAVETPDEADDWLETQGITDVSSLPTGITVDVYDDEIDEQIS